MDLRAFDKFCIAARSEFYSYNRSDISMLASKKGRVIIEESRLSRIVGSVSSA